MLTKLSKVLGLSVHLQNGQIKFVYQGHRGQGHGQGQGQVRALQTHATEIIITPTPFTGGKKFQF